MRFSSLLLMAFCLGAQVRTEMVDRIFSGFNNRSPGCAVGVMQGGKLAFAAGYGMADLERSVPISENSVFESGSVAKQFTAATLMLLAQQGKISLDDPMRKYLPELRDYGKPLTIRHVLHHISGLREWRPIAYFHGEAEGSKVLENEDLLRFASAQRALNFDPGTNYTYSNTGFNIATILVERALSKKQSFTAYTKEQIFQPLGMSQTQWRDDFRRVIPNRALAYSSRGGGYVNATPIENIIGAGGLLTTVKDLLAWNENFKHAKVGGAEFVKAQQIPATLENGKTIAYAAGLMLGQLGQRKEVAHGGATGGYRTWLGRYPEADLSVAVLCNSAQADALGLGRRTAKLWLGASAEEEVIQSTKVDPARLSALAGMYRKVRDHSVLILEWKEGKLVNSSGAELKFLSEMELRAGSAKVEVIRAPRPGLRFTDNNDSVLYERVEPVKPSFAELQEYQGRYRSAEVTLPLEVEVNAEGVLTGRRGGDQPLPFKATYQDAFSAATLGAIRFWRDADGKVTGLSVGDARLWDLRFVRER